MKVQTIFDMNIKRIGSQNRNRMLKKKDWALYMYYTGWPRKNATTLFVNFKDIINKNGI